MKVLPINNYYNDNYNKNYDITCFKSTLCLQSGKNSFKNHQSILRKCKNFMTKLVWNPRDKENLGFLSRNISSLRFMDKEWQASDESIAISIDILKAYSKNKEYTEFIQQGVAFFQRNKGNDKLYSVRDNVYNQQCLDEGGQDVIRCMLMTYENAVSRKKNYDDEKLKTDIDYSKKYMDAFTNEGKSLYPEGFPSYAELRKWQESHRN